MTIKSSKLYKRIILIFSIIAIIAIIGSITLRQSYKASNAVVATNVSRALELIGENNPLRQILDAEIKRLADVKAIREAEEERLEEEKRLAEEKRIEEEKVKAAEEERKRIEEEKIKNQKVAYLTFDDGPSEKVTPLILDILHRYDIKATFFVLGKMVEENPTILNRIYEEGHSIGHHSYSHNYSFIYKNTDNFLKEINYTKEVFNQVLGDDFDTNLLRLPGGSFEQYKQKYVRAAADEGYINYNWDALNGDAEGKDLTRERLVNRLKSTIKGRKEVIILMHDTDTKMATVDTLPEIIEYLIDLGYVFRPLEQEIVKDVIVNE